MQAPSSDASATVQHVDRKRSDQLLSKFADSGEHERKDPRAPKRRRRDRRVAASADLCESQALGERRSLLPPVERRSALLWKLGAIRRVQPGTRNVRNKSLLGAIEKTWRRTVEGASRVFVEKHYNRHKRLISDAVEVS
ncbi:uncharacterized protein LOC115732336 [Rhodamnia argentea]|uniref:Uncharacterized protein LOC115732336 n=1 Tax=Rhodamnia argentea TaxID=178133 RepID=A0A8B8N8T3_9MYRT|nr:uncharacterized protein LOC115732336 [Rhodamnia argentea]